MRNDTAQKPICTNTLREKRLVSSIDQVPDMVKMGVMMMTVMKTANSSESFGV